MVRFEVRNVAVQGVHAVPQVIQAVKELDDLDEVDVIIVARGGGSVEDLLPFSDEEVVRAVAAARTPVVSAIGHEPDSPLLDLVADLRASTPTDAAKKVVPDVGEELERVRQLQARGLRAVNGLLDREERGLAHALARPVFVHPQRMVETREDELEALLARGRMDARASAGPGRLGARAHPGPGGGAVPGRDPGAGLRRPAAGGRARGAFAGGGLGGRGAARAGHGRRVLGTGGRVRVARGRPQTRHTTAINTSHHTHRLDEGMAEAETALGYEQARDELIEVVRKLEAGGTSLEDSLALWERGEELAKVCRRLAGGGAGAAGLGARGPGLGRSGREGVIPVTGRGI